MSDALLIGAVAAIAWLIIRRGQDQLIGTMPQPAAPRPPAVEVPLPAPLPARAPRRTERLGGLAKLPATLARLLVRVRRRLDVGGAFRPLVLHHRGVIGSAIVLALSVFIWFVWPTPYRDLPLGASGGRIGTGFDVLALRQQRLTGRVDALIDRGGWVCLIGCGGSR